MMEDVKQDLHKIFVEVTSRGGMEEVKREGRLKEVCNAIGIDSIREPRHLSHKCSEFLPGKDELQYCDDQAIKSFRSDPQTRMVESGLTQETLVPQCSLPAAAARTKDTTKTIPKFISSKKKSLFKKPETVKKIRSIAITEEIPEFLFSDKRSSSTNPLQFNVKPRTALQDIPEFLYSDKRHSYKGRIQDIEKLKEKEEGESIDEVVTNSYEEFRPGRKFSYGNCELKGKHAEAHDWGRDLSLAVGESASKVLPESEQIEDKDMNTSK